MPANAKAQECIGYSWVDETVDSRITPNNNRRTQSRIDSSGEQVTPTPTQRILNIDCSIKRSIDIAILYEDGNSNNVEVTKGDRVQITYVNEARLQTERGIITAILKGPKTLNRITNKLQHVYSLKIDCSTKYSSKTIIVYCELIRDISVLSPEEYDVDLDYLEKNYFDKSQVDYLISWQDIDGTELD